MTKETLKKEWIGKEIKGFIFPSKPGMSYNKKMDKHIGHTGTIIDVNRSIIDICYVKFETPEKNSWWYPLNLIKEHVVKDTLDIKEILLKIKQL